ncbi:hypothetical protein PR048_027735 [Dryococelus australis]|uniref:Uncharacterized protein n=1 Tax=Dryococelus australis TaxID=614101 RepID=A0ABQ9GHB8_9NEOP|nr:hypothetical protein PR048_027735 [Dryococelus australis]
MTPRPDNLDYFNFLVEWLDYSPLTQSNQVRFPLGLLGLLPYFRMWESCRTMPMVSGFSRGYPASSALFGSYKYQTRRSSREIPLLPHERGVVVQFSSDSGRERLDESCPMCAYYLSVKRQSRSAVFNSTAVEGDVISLVCIPPAVSRGFPPTSGSRESNFLHCLLYVPSLKAAQGQAHRCADLAVPRLQHHWMSGKSSMPVYADGKAGKVAHVELPTCDACPLVTCFYGDARCWCVLQEGVQLLVIRWSCMFVDSHCPNYRCGKCLALLGKRPIHPRQRGRQFSLLVPLSTQSRENALFIPASAGGRQFSLLVPLSTQSRENALFIPASAGGSFHCSCRFPLRAQKTPYSSPPARAAVFTARAAFHSEQRKRPIHPRQCGRQFSLFVPLSTQSTENALFIPASAGGSFHCSCRFPLRAEKTPYSSPPVRAAVFTVRAAFHSEHRKRPIHPRQRGRAAVFTARAAFHSEHMFMSRPRDESPSPRHADANQTRVPHLTDIPAVTSRMTYSWNMKHRTDHSYSFNYKTVGGGGGNEVAERLACAPPTKTNRVRSRPGHRTFPSGNRRRSTGLLRDLPLPLPITALLRSHLTHPHWLSRPGCKSHTVSHIVCWCHLRHSSIFLFTAPSHPSPFLVRRRKASPWSRYARIKTVSLYYLLASHPFSAATPPPTPFAAATREFPALRVTYCSPGMGLETARFHDARLDSSTNSSEDLAFELSGCLPFEVEQLMPGCAIVVPKLDPRSDLRSTQKTVAPFEFRAGLEIEMKFISNRRNSGFEISIRDQQPSSTNLDYSPPNVTNLVRFPAGSLPRFPHVDWFSRGSPVFPVIRYRVFSILTSLHPNGSQDLYIKNHLNTWQTEKNSYQSLQIRLYMFRCNCLSNREAAALIRKDDERDRGERVRVWRISRGLTRHARLTACSGVFDRLVLTESPLLNYLTCRRLGSPRRLAAFPPRFGEYGCRQLLRVGGRVRFDELHRSSFETITVERGLLGRLEKGGREGLKHLETRGRSESVEFPPSHTVGTMEWYPAMHDLFVLSPHSDHLSISRVLTWGRNAISTYLIVARPLRPDIWGTPSPKLDNSFMDSGETIAARDNCRDVQSIDDRSCGLPCSFDNSGQTGNSAADHPLTKCWTTTTCEHP